MTTYNTYQEAKIANPESNIYIHTGEFWCEKSIRPSSWTYEFRGFKLCNPADYCMTVEKFLADGNKLEFTDIITCSNGSVVSVANWIMDGVSKYYILRAAALEERANLESAIESVARSQFDEIVKVTPAYSKPRIKVEYVKWNFECAWHAVKAFEDGERLYTKRSHKDYILIDNAPDVLRFLYDLHERIETTISWQEELYDYLDNSCEMSDEFDDSFTLTTDSRPLEFNLSDDEFVDMCKFVASLNSVN